jgi:hypothetical protein
MPYSIALAKSLKHDAQKVRGQFDDVLIALAQAASDALPPKSAEHLSQGAGRRIGVLGHCITTIFKKFPPSAHRPLQRSDLYDVQIAHHAFVINLYGFFENLAWAFILRHGLEAEVGGRKKIGLFLNSTQRLLPPSIRDYLTSTTMVAWHNDYLKNYRDALAHRVPLYIPPSALTDADVVELNTIAQQEQEALNERKWDVLDDLRERKLSLGRPCLFFAHSYSDDEDPRPIYLHPQILCDAKTVVDFVPTFLKGWHEHA